MPAPGGCWDSELELGVSVCEREVQGELARAWATALTATRAERKKEKKGIRRRCIVVLALRFCGFATGVKGALAVGILS